MGRLVKLKSMEGIYFISSLPLPFAQPFYIQLLVLVLRTPAISRLNIFPGGVRSSIIMSEWMLLIGCNGDLGHIWTSPLSSRWTSQAVIWKDKVAARKSYVYCSEHCGERATHKYYDHSCKSINVIINDKSPFHHSPDFFLKKFRF